MRASPILTTAFVVLAIAVALAAVAAVAWGESRRARPSARTTAVAFAAGLAGWLAATALLARAGLLADFSLPPKIVLLFAVSLVLTLTLALSNRALAIAEALPWWALIGINAFRLPLELVMHRAATEGVMPVQMSFSGYNFDVLTGIGALLLGAWGLLRPIPRAAILGWTALGSLLLLNVVVIAVLSMPTPLRVFMNEPANVWVTRAPFVWLPVFFVQLAVLTHVLAFRRWRAESVASGATTG
jgi:hypothetical protein